MEKQEVKSNWDELLREIGADVSPEIEQREAAISAAADDPEAMPTSEPAERAAAVRPPAKRVAPGWDTLASEWGLPPAEAPELSSTPEPPAAEPRAPAPTRQREESIVASKADRPKRERQPRERRPQHRQDRLPRESDEPPRKHKQPRELGAGVEDRSESRVEERVSPPAPPAPRDEPAKPGAAVSLWHKIFGSPAEQAAKITGATSDTSDTIETSARDETREESDRYFASESTIVSERVEKESFAGEIRGDKSLDETADTDLAGRKPRHPRRRRRGRGRNSESARDSERQPGRGDDSARQRHHRRADAGDDFEDAGLHDDDTDDEEIASEQDSDDDEADVDRSGTPVASVAKGKLARSIPTWDDAIGFIVDSNLQTRTQRRHSTHPRQRADSPRGRGRGRRKK